MIQHYLTAPRACWPATNILCNNTLGGVWNPPRPSVKIVL
jgi:hypothetical protein